MFGALAMVAAWVVLAALIVAAAVVIVPLALVVLLTVGVWRGAGGALQAVWPGRDGRKNVRVLTRDDGPP
jgi:hypothetical protein